MVNSLKALTKLYDFNYVNYEKNKENVILEIQDSQCKFFDKKKTIKKENNRIIAQDITEDDVIICRASSGISFYLLEKNPLHYYKECNNTIKEIRWSNGTTYNLPFVKISSVCGDKEITLNIELPEYQLTFI